MAIDFGEPVLLLTADTEITADMLVGLLKENGIPAFKQFNGAWGALRITYGVSGLDAEVYVPQALLEQAQQLVAAFFSADYADNEVFTDEG